MTTPSQRMQQGVAELLGSKGPMGKIRIPLPDPLGILKKVTRNGPIEIEDPLGVMLMEDMDRIMKMGPRLR